MAHPNPATTAQVWRELSDRLRRFVSARIPRHSDVDDLLQTIFLRIHAKLPELQSVERLESWVFQITRNAISDHYRQYGREPQGSETDWIASQNAESPNANAEIAACLRPLIEQLPQPQRRALQQFELEGVSQIEIARREKITHSAAKSRVQRARRALKDLLESCCQLEMDSVGNILDYETRGQEDCDDGCRCPAD